MNWWPWSASKPSAPLSRTAFVVLDLEMSGLNPAQDAILALGAVRMTGGRIELGSGYSALVRPACGLSAESVRVHQLTPAQLACQPDIGAALPAFLEFCGDAVLAGWHVGFDAAFLNRWVKRLGLPPLRNAFLDVLGLYLAIRGGHGSALLDGVPLKDATLYTVARALGIPPRGAHDALGDAFLTAQVLQRFLSILRSERPGEELSLATLLRLADPATAIRGAPVPAF